MGHGGAGKVVQWRVVRLVARTYCVQTGGTYIADSRSAWHMAGSRDFRMSHLKP